MPIQRPPTEQEAEWYRQQGIDPSNVLLTEEDPQEQRQPISMLGAAGRTAEAHAGGYLGGAGGLAAASWLLGPEAGIPATLIAGALGAAGGGYAGQKAQDVALGDEKTKELQEQAAEAAEQHPLVSGATDIGLSALLSGGKPNLSNIPKAGRGVLNTLTGKGALSEADSLALKLGAKAAMSDAGAETLANRDAMAKIALGSVVNPAINTGIGLATTGELPTGKDLLAQAAGGALFSEQSKYGRKLMGHPESQAEPTANGTETPPVTAEPEVKPTSPFNAVDETGTPHIDDTGIKTAYSKLINPKPDIKGMADTDAYKAMSQWRAGNKVPVDDMRQQLHDAHLAQQAKLDAVKIPVEPKPEPTQKDMGGYEGGEMDNTTNLGDRTAAQPVQSVGYSPDEITQLQQRKQSVVEAVKEWQQEQTLNGPASQHPDVIEAQKKAVDAQKKLEEFQNGLKEKYQQDKSIEQPVNANTLKITKDSLLPSGVGRQETRPIVGEEKPVTNAQQEPSLAEQHELEQDKLNNGAKHYAPGKDDVEDYNTLKAQFQSHIQKGDFSSPEFLKTFKALEEVKNKNGGMPPVSKGKNTSTISQGNWHDDLHEQLSGKRSNVKSVLETIASSNNKWQSLANHLLNTANEGKLKTHVQNTDTGRSHYNVQEKRIELQDEHTGNASIIMHEIGHALLSNNLPSEFDRLRSKKLKAKMDSYLADPNKNEHIKELIRSYYEAAKGLGVHDELFSDKLVDRHIRVDSYPSTFIDVRGGKSYKSFDVNTQKEANHVKSWLSNHDVEIAHMHDGGKDNYGVRISPEDYQKLQSSGLLDKFGGISINEKRTGYVRGLAGSPDSASSRLPHGYAMGDLHEFTTALMSNDKFQKALNEMPSGRNDNQSLWSRIVESVRNILGVPVKEKSLLERALKANDELIKTPNQEKDWPTDWRDKLPKSVEELDALNNKLRGSDQELQDKIITRIQELNGAKKYAPKSSSTKGDEVKENTSHLGWFGNITRSMVDRISDIPHPAAKTVAAAFKKVLNERTERVGATWNKIKTEMDRVGFTKKDDEQLQRISEYENLNKKPAPSTMFRTPAQRAVYKVEREVYDESGKYRIKNGEPVYRDGKPTTLQQDPTAHPTTPNPRIVEVYKANTDTKQIAALDKIFIDHGMKNGLTKGQAEENLQNFKSGVQGNMQKADGNLAFYNAARRSQGISLPTEFTRQSYSKNLEAYYHRQATDNTFYKNVEADHKVLSSLGETKDAWGRPVAKDPTGGIANNSSVKAQLAEFQGEQGGMGFHNEKGLSSLATTLFIANPGLIVHKVVSNLLGITNYADNPVQLGRMLGAMVTNMNEGVVHATENGLVKLTARSLGDALDRNSTLSERMQALAHGIRSISDLGMLTDKWSSGLMQAGAESVLPLKIEKAAKGDTTAQQLLKKLDPTYTVGKTYTPNEVQKLSSILASYIHGTGDGRTMPAFMSSDTELSGFFKLAHWSVSQTNRFMSDVLTPATKGDIAPLLTSVFGAAVGGYLIKEVREKIQGKHGQIPSLGEIADSEKGLSGNKGLVAYNLIAATQYAGFGGLLSQIAKYPMDFAYKNNPQGATFPMDEIVGDMAKTMGEVSTAIANDPNINWLHLAEQVAGHVVTTNFQLGRIAYNQAINNGIIEGSLADKKALSDKLGQLRRFEMVSGLPYEEQNQPGSNPYMNIEQKRFKQEQNPEEAMKMLPGLITNIIDTYKDKPDVMMSKLEALKQNSYATFPSLKKAPLSFMKYIAYLTKQEGPDKAHDAMLDFFKHKAMNEAKGSVVP